VKLQPVSFHYSPCPSTTARVLPLQPVSLHYSPCPYTTARVLTLQPVSLHYSPCDFSCCHRHLLITACINYRWQIQLSYHFRLSGSRLLGGGGGISSNDQPLTRASEIWAYFLSTQQRVLTDVNSLAIPCFSMIHSLHLRQGRNCGNQAAQHIFFNLPRLKRVSHPAQKG